MKKLTLLILLLTGLANAQNDRVVLRGLVHADSIRITDAHVINLSSKRGTSTDDQGVFTIWAKVSDTIIISNLAYYDKSWVLSKEDIKNTTTLFRLTPRRIELEEVLLKKTNNMAGALNLPNAGKEPLTKLERQLNQYSQASTPLVVLGALLGQKGGISDLYNIISGNRKKHRKLNQYIQEDMERDRYFLICEEIQEHFGESFFTEILKIPKEWINPFLLHCKKFNVSYLFEEQRYLELTDVFIREKGYFLEAVQNE
ncbi:hypothetical protein [Namhaeicola litoreus]|uniref:CarboxypepD_reg-like domain-containing protein n=1 Tax=Namhaeicola litoreus TaxID=1052145 RepID=A0ABW3Y7Z6_9FLAO